MIYSSGIKCNSYVNHQNYFRFVKWPIKFKAEVDSRFLKEQMRHFRTTFTFPIILLFFLFKIFL